MTEPLQFTFILYYLVLPMVVGMGIDSKIKNRYPAGASCGIIFYSICALWIYFNIPLRYGIIEPIIVMIAASLSLLFIGYIFEYQRPYSGFRRHAVVLITVSFSGLPLFAIRAIMEGEMGFTYPASVLPLFQFSLAVLGLVFLGNAFAARLYSKNEGLNKNDAHRDEGIIGMKLSKIDEIISEGESGFPKEKRDYDSLPDVSVMDMNYNPEDFQRK